MHLTRYPRFFLVGSAVGVTAAGVLAMAERMLPATAAAYVAAVLAVYGAGFAASYVLQRRFTFRAKGARQMREFRRFVLVSLAGAAITGTLSFCLKYGLPWPASLEPFAGIASFVVACLAASVVTYVLNHTWVFPPDK